MYSGILFTALFRLVTERERSVQIQLVLHLKCLHYSKYSRQRTEEKRAVTLLPPLCYQQCNG